LAGAGGLCVGEGDVGVTRGGSEITLHVSQSGIVREPPDLLLRFRTSVGGMGFVEGPAFVVGRRPKWRYRATGFEIVQAIIAMLWPWLGVVKRAQASTALRAYVAIPRGPRRPGNHFGRPLNLHCKRGHDYSDVYVDLHGVRHC